MDDKKVLGKISTAHFGYGGYQNACIGLTLGLKFEGGGVYTDKTAWDQNKIEWSESCKWSEADRSKSNDEIVRYISDLLKDAKVSKVDDLKNIPVEITLNCNVFKAVRILTEVL